MDASRDRAKAIIRQIIRLSGGCFDGKTRLYKAFYLSHLYYYLNNPGMLSSWPIVKMPQGPGIHEGRELLQEMEANNEIAVSFHRNGPFPETVFRLVTETANELPDGADGAILAALAYVDGRTGTELSNYLHENSRSWNSAKSGEPLNLYVDVLSDEEYERESEQLDDMSARLEGMLD